MKKLSYTILLITGLAMGLFSIQSCSSGGKGPKVLILAKSEFYFHESTPAALDALSKLCEDNGWEVEAVDDGWETFTEKQLPKYAAIVFLNTAGDVLNPTQEALFEQYIQAGGGFVGIHTAIDTEHSWEWYGRLVGGQFDGMTEVQGATLLVQDPENPATQHFDSTWQHKDEWFNLVDLSPDLNVLITLDESTCEGGKMGDFHPISWYHEFDGGRSFITTLGHTSKSYSDPAFLKHLSGGLKYAVGKNTGEPLRFKRRRSSTSNTTVTGFVRTQLICNLYEPMELEMLPDGRVIIIERRGTVKLYDPAKDSVSVIGEFDLYLLNEEGLLGVALDPDWEENHWLYLYYSPAGKSSAIKLSRFKFSGDVIQRETEQVILEVETDRSVHNFHASGCIEFDAKGFLYLSCGDNTDHYSDGYSPIDERLGNSQYDAQKSAANTMDLRGSILRIKVLDDGSYLCPADNLFNTEVVHMRKGKRVVTEDLIWEGVEAFMPDRATKNEEMALLNPNEEKPWYGLPEIYVMGLRNPFRFDIDDKREILFWGSPGPDAGGESELRGPLGYDEFNFTREAGNFGWPYVLGPNIPYRDYNFETGESGDFFDPDSLINDSPNNTGSRLLPPAKPAIIWYPYRSSAEFPILLNGTRNAMGGPVYWCDDYPPETRFPDRYDGQVIIYDWMRHWMFTYGIDSLDQLTKIQPLASNIRFARPMDMLIDKNGSLWVLEYGTEWYAQNPDACLSRIDYIRVEGMEEPLLVEGVNNPPTVRWDLRGQNQSFYKPGEQVRYSVAVSDPEDGSLDDQRITSDMVDISIEYLDEVEQAGVLVSSYEPVADTPEAKGKALINESDCKSCHALERKVNGPSYKDIAEYYEETKGTLDDLSKKIIEGGAGVWGEELYMAAHPDISEKDASNMASWILSISDPENYPLPTVGLYTLNLPETANGNGAFVFHARYKDVAGVELESNLGSHTLVLRSPTQPLTYADSLSKDIRMENGLCQVGNGSVFVYKNIDLRGIRSVDIMLGTPIDGDVAAQARIEMRIGKPDGRLAGSVALNAENPASSTEITMEVDRSTWPTNKALFDLYFVVVDDAGNSGPLAAIDRLRFNL